MANASVPERDYANTRLDETQQSPALNKLHLSGPAFHLSCQGNVTEAILQETVSHAGLSSLSAANEMHRFFQMTFDAYRTRGKDNHTQI